MREYNRLVVEQLHKMAERRLLREKMARNAAHCEYYLPCVVDINIYSVLCAGYMEAV